MYTQFQQYSESGHDDWTAPIEIIREELPDIFGEIKFNAAGQSETFTVFDATGFTRIWFEREDA